MTNQTHVSPAGLGAIESPQDPLLTLMTDICRDHANDIIRQLPAPALYSRDYFIQKFAAIPEEFWACGNYVNKFGGKCALGFCEEAQGTFSAESNALRGLSGDQRWTPGNINDGEDPRYQQSSPKQRILAALRDLPQ